MPTGRRHHTIPKFYLEPFFPGWCYHRQTASPRYHKNAKDVAVHRDYYGGSADVVQALDRVNSLIENETAPVLQRVVRDPASITRKDRVTLSYFFANIHVRTPSFHESMKRDFQKATEELNRMARAMVDRVREVKADGRDMSVLEMLPDDDSPKYTIDDWNKGVQELETENGRRGMMADLYQSIQDVAGYIQRMSLFILSAPGALFFVTTDRPLTLLSMSSDTMLGAGWGREDAFAMLPLSPRHFVTMFYAGPATVRGKELSTPEVRFFNDEMMKYASMEIYSKYPYNLALDWMRRKGRWSVPKTGNRRE